MKWRDAEARLAAKNATVVRAALAQSIDPVAIWRGYQETHPIKTDNLTQDRARARAWAMLSVNFNNEALEAALRKTWSEGWVTGWAAAPEMIEARKDLTETVVDWDRWKPGDAATAALVRPPGALKAILDSVGIEIKNMTRTGYDLLGTQLADAVAAGLNERRAAKLIRGAVASPSRALMIAVTEQNRAVSTATMQRYIEAGLDRVEWATSDPCPTCAVNSGQVVPIGSSFNSGHDRPPAHPWCRCTLTPVLDEAEPDPTAGSMAPMVPETAVVSPTIAPKPTADEVMKNAKVLRGRADELEDVAVRGGYGYGDYRHAAINEFMGLDAKPQLVSAETMDKLVDQGWSQLYRGVQDTVIGFDNKTAASMVADFQEGEFFAGLGVYGNGTYTSNFFDTAEGYAGGAWMLDQGEGRVMRLALSPEAKTIDYNDLFKEIEKVQWSEAPPGSESLLGDPGRWAAANGYDAIIKDHGTGEKYVVVLNRGAVAVQKDTVKTGWSG